MSHWRFCSIDWACRGIGGGAALRGGRLWSHGGILGSHKGFRALGVTARSPCPETGRWRPCPCRVGGRSMSHTRPPELNCSGRSHWRAVSEFCRLSIPLTQSVWSHRYGCADKDCMFSRKGLTVGMYRVLAGCLRDCALPSSRESFICGLTGWLGERRQKPGCFTCTERVLDCSRRKS